MKKITQELRQQLALQAAVQTQRKLAKKSLLSTKTISDVIKGRQKTALDATFQKLVIAANGGSVKGIAVSSTTPSASESQLEPSKLLNSLVKTSLKVGKPAKNVSENKDKESDSPKLKNALEEIKSLHELLTLNKELTEMLIKKVNLVQESREDTTKQEIENFRLYSNATNKRLDKLEANFATLLKRHTYQTEENKDLKERVKKLEIKIYPSNFSNVKK